MTQPEHSPRIVLAVTAPVSLALMRGFPEHLASRGWDVHVVTSGVPTDFYGPCITVHNVKMARDPSPIVDSRALVQWLTVLWRLRPDIVVAGTPKAGLLGMVAAWCLRVPARVYLLRGLRLETERGVRRRVLLAMEWLSARCSTRVQSVSRSLRDEFVALRLAPDDKVVVLGAGSSNGVEVPEEGSLLPLTAGQIGLSDGRPVVGLVGRLCRDKGLGTLVEAVRRVRESGVDAQLLLVGAEEPEGALAVALRQGGVPKSSVVWVGSVPDARPYYRAMDVLCLPTRREGFPNVVLEAAVHNVPAVVSNVTGARDAVVDGCTGVLVPVDDPRALADELRRLLAAPAALEAMGRAARLHALAHYRREEVWQLNETFLASSINTGNGSKR